MPLTSTKFTQQKVIQHLEPKVIVPIHWDDFMQAGIELKPPKCLFENFTKEIDALLEINNNSKHRAKVVLLKSGDTVYLDMINEND